MKIVTKAFIEKLRSNRGSQYRARLNKLISQLGKDEAVFIHKKEYAQRGYKSYVGSLIDSKIKKTVAIKSYKKGWAITRN